MVDWESPAQPSKLTLSLRRHLHSMRTGNPPFPTPILTPQQLPTPAVISKKTLTEGFPRATYFLLSSDYQVDMLRICDVEDGLFIHVESHIIMPAQSQGDIRASRD